MLSDMYIIKKNIYIYNWDLRVSQQLSRGGAAATRRPEDAEEDEAEAEMRRFCFVRGKFKSGRRWSQTNTKWINPAETNNMPAVWQPPPWMWSRSFCFYFPHKCFVSLKFEGKIRLCVSNVWVASALENIYHVTFIRKLYVSYVLFLYIVLFSIIQLHVQHVFCAHIWRFCRHVTHVHSQNKSAQHKMN